MPTRFLIFLLLYVCCVSCNSQLSQNTQATKPPNIVFILVDDLGREWVSAYGTKEIETPNVDALAATGTRFEHVYAMPQCTPTRLTLLTGQYPFRHGWVNHWDVPRWGGGAHFDDELYPSLGRAMKEAGYASCIAGKWQIDDFRIEPDALTKSGFDAYCMWTGYETGIPASAERYQDPYVFEGGISSTRAGAFGPDVFTEYICQFIQSHADQPFFVYYPMVITHTPFVNTPDEKAETPLDKHKAMVRYMDKLVGRIVQTIDDAGIREQTLIIWTTDNGTSGQISGRIGNQAVKGAKSETNEWGTAMPFITNWQGVQSNSRISDALIDFTDILPTFLDLAGSAPDTSWSLDGKSFAEVLRKPGADGQREWIMSMGGGNFAKLTDQGVENQYVYRDRVLRNKRYKLYIDTHRQASHFYDMTQDPFEQTDLIDSLHLPELTKNFEQLQAAAATFPETDADPQYRPNPPQPWDVAVTATSLIWKIQP